jgi:hypothetical protein
MSAKHSALEVVELLKKEQDEDIAEIEIAHGLCIGKDVFTARSVSGSHCIIYPPPEFFENLYRGQCEFHQNCFSSIYRGKPAPTALDAFIARMKNLEFELLIKKHPFVEGLSEVRICDQLIRIDYEGLAQHYGLRTELIDLTSDPYVAGFFATCKYNKKRNAYEPIMEKDTHGVIYCYNFMLDLPNNNDMRYTNGIGLQPLPRPGIQKAFSYRLRKKECFDKMRFVSTYAFHHNPSVSLKFYEMFDGGKLLFPEDIMDSIAKAISDSMVFSEHAFFLAARRYWNNNGTEALRNKLKRKGFAIVDDELFKFTDEKIALLREQWPQERDSFISKVKFRRVFQQSVKPIGCA